MGTERVAGTAGEDQVTWHVTRRWLLSCLGAVLSVVGLAAALLVWLADLDPLDLALRTLSQVLVQLGLMSVVGGLGLRHERLVLDATGVTVVSVNRRSVRWEDVEALEGDHLQFAVSTERTADTGIKISYDPHIRSLPARRRTLRLRRFLTDDRRGELRRLVARHRPDLVDGSPRWT